MKQLTSITFTSTVDIGTLVEDLSQEQARSLIIQADEAQACWGFTHEMAKHFLQQMKVLIDSAEDDTMTYSNELKEIFG